MSGAVATSQHVEKIPFIKLYGNLQCSSRNREFIDKYSQRDDCALLRSDETFKSVIDFCNESIVGYTYPGYGINDKDRINVIYGLIAFALDVGKQIFFSVDKNYCVFWNIFDMVPILRKLGYMPGGTND